LAGRKGRLQKLVEALRVDRRNVDGASVPVSVCAAKPSSNGVGFAYGIPSSLTDFVEEIATARGPAGEGDWWFQMTLEAL